MYKKMKCKQTNTYIIVKLFVLKEKYKRMLTRAAQRMMVHIWAVHQGHLDPEKEINEEITTPDELYGIDDYDLVGWDEEVVHEEALDGVFADHEWEEAEPCDMDNPDQDAPTRPTQRPNIPSTAEAAAPTDDASAHARGAQPAYRQLMIRQRRSDQGV